MHYLRDLLVDLGVARRPLCADQAGYPPVWGYQGPSLAALLQQPVSEAVASFLLHHRSIKSPEVLALIRLSAAWGHYAHGLMQQAIQVGANEVEVGQTASHAATLAFFQAVGDRYRNHDWGVTPIHVGFKAGPATAIPHPMGGSRPMQAGDLLVTWATAKLAGYHAELERTLILGEPSAEQRAYFTAMCEAQEIGILVMRPGARCADVDAAVYTYWEAQGLLPYVRHHTGHGLDMEIHAPPFLDRGDRTVLEPGMLFSVEPGLYVPGLGGFRHSDTVLITDTGCEVLTRYPRDLASLTIPV
jgi:Xaa-Pro aminopeptidase